jgi:putative MATE family efflux protein
MDATVTPPPKPPNPLVTAPILPTLARLSLPNMIAMFATSLVAIAETSYVGILGTTSLAALALVFPMVMLQQMMSAGAMGGGISSAISRALGAGDRARANALAIHAVIIGGCAGIIFTAIFLIWGPQIYQSLGGRGAVLAETLAYSNIVFLGATSIWLTNTLASVLRGSGNMRLPSIILFAAAIAQVVLGGALGLGLLGLPRFGMAGVAAGQVLAFTASALAMLLVLTSGLAPNRLTFRGVPLEAKQFADILKVGAIAIISPLQSVLTVLIVTRLVSSFGIEALAGYGIGSRLEFLLVPIIFAIGVASVPMVGMAIGAGNVPRARRVAWTAAISGGCLVGAIGLLVTLWPGLWSRMFTSDPAVLAAAAQYFKFAGPAYAFYGFGLALYFATQGSGRILGPVLAQSLRLLVIVVGGLMLAADAPAWIMFALVGAAMVTYGLASAFALYIAKWG